MVNSDYKYWNYNICVSYACNMDMDSFGITNQIQSYWFEVLIPFVHSSMHTSTFTIPYPSCWVFGIDVGLIIPTIASVVMLGISFYK